MARRIAVSGATGLIGGAVIRALRERGDEVVALVRSPPRRGFDPSITQRAWDATAPAADLEGVDAVVHLAGAPVAEGRWTPARKRAIELSRILGTRSIVEGIRASGSVKTLVSGSGIDLHGDTGARIIDESAPPGEGFLPDLAVRWEREAAAAREAGARVVLLRTGMVLARGAGALEKMEPIFRLGLGARLGNGRQMVPWIHLADEVGLILHALDRPEVEGPLLAVAPHPVSNRDFTRSFARALGRPALAYAPRWALRILLGEMADILLSSHDARPAKALETGYRFQFETLDGAWEDLYRGLSASSPASSRRGR